MVEDCNGYTRRSLLVFEPGVSTHQFADFVNALAAELRSPTGAPRPASRYFRRFDVAVVDFSPAQIDPEFARQHGVSMIEPERIVRIPEDAPDDDRPLVAGVPFDALGALGARTSSYTGRNVSIAILDTGLAMDHPDFRARTIVSKSHVQGLSVIDQNGHGTHCAGLALGPRAGNGYGVAPKARCLIGRVLDDDGFGDDGDVIAGIEWALAEGADIISMSLGAPMQAGQYDKTYERVASRALAAGTLIVAAAGNGSSATVVFPIDHPANAPSIMSAAALRDATTRWEHSRGHVPGSDLLDISAPGVEILSAWPRDPFYVSRTGTSVATPLIAGVAALWQEASVMSGWDLWSLIRTQANDLHLPDLTGAGCARSPQ